MTYRATRGCLCWLLALAGCAGADDGRAKGGLVPFAPAAEVDRAAAPRRFGLLVGIDRFEDERWRPLKHAAQDAADLAARLQGFDTTVLTGAEATERAHVLTALAELADRATRPEDVVVVYLSSHGTLARPPGGSLSRYAVAADTQKRLVSETGLSVADLLRGLDRIPSRRKVLILALCHSGAGKSQLPDELSRALAEAKADLAALRPIEERSEAVIVLTACAFGETARESDRLGHDIYTHFLIEALAAGDLNEDGAVTASEAHSYARERTYAFTRGEQRPTVEGSMIGVDPIVLAGERTREGRPVLYSASPSAEGLVVLLDGRIKGELPSEIATEAGTHRLELRAGEQGEVLYSGEVALAPGQRVELSRLIPPRARLGPVLELGLLAPLTSDFREGFRPLSLLATLGLRIDHALFSWAFVDLVATLAPGHGEVPGVGGELQAKVTEIGGAARLGYLFSGDWLAVRAGLQLRAAHLDRQIGSDRFRSRDSAWLAGAGALGALALRPVRELELGLSATIEGIGLRTDGALRIEPQLHLLGSVSLVY